MTVLDPELMALTDKALRELYENPSFHAALKALHMPTDPDACNIRNLLIKQAFAHGFKAGAEFVAAGPSRNLQ